jgi:hypothetical protein
MITLTKGYVAELDDEEYPRLARHKWTAFVAGDRVYAYRRYTPYPGAKTVGVLMHREVMRAAKGEKVGHLSGVGLNCRKDNLRKCSHSQVVGHRGPHKGNRSGKKGITVRDGPRGRKYYVRLHAYGKTYCLGTYSDLELALSKRLEKAKELFGEFAA